MGKSDYEYLDEERKKLWYKVNSVETDLNKRIDDELNKKASDYSDEAKQSSRKASEYRNASEKSKSTILEYLDDATTNLANLKGIVTNVEALSTQITQNANASKSNSDLIIQIYEDVDERKSAIDEHLEKIEELLEDYDNLVDKIDKLDDLVIKSDDLSSKTETLYKSLLVRKKDIDQIHSDIFGYTDKDLSTGEETTVEGLKDQLEEAYEDVIEKIDKANNDISNLVQDTKLAFTNFSATNRVTFDKTISDWNAHYSELSIKIKELLPNALTAGLSSAYSVKKDSEIAECAKLNITFNWAIFGLVAISLIPFGISFISYIHQKTLEAVLLDMPRLVLSILPLYVPILWVAYSSNRKMNLSKRLSEEYSHKEVLSKTFEGLSTQINNIGDEKISSDLRNKLLYNILEVSSENPGKLISDYNKSDHPLMDALDKSVKLATAFEKLAKIPGFSSLAKAMDKKSKAILEDEDEKAKKAIASLDNEEEEED